VVDEKFDAIKLVSSMQLDQKSSRRLFRRRWKQPETQDVAGYGIDGIHES